MGHESWHESYESLSAETRDMHRAIVSLMEELEAIDWYQQRADVTPDAELKAVIEHNRDEEIEHAMMTLEWIRRKSPKFHGAARTYLFTEGPITEIEEEVKVATGSAGAAPSPSAEPATARHLPAEDGGAPSDSTLGIGSLNPGGGRK